MKAYVGKPIFTGNWDEDLDTCISVFNTLSKMCGMTDEDKVKSIPVMLSGDALSYFASNINENDEFTRATKLLREWYNSDDKKARILTKWQTMTLSEAMADEPKSSDVSVFRKFVAKLVSFQKQLDEIYHTDTFLR